MTNSSKSNNPIKSKKIAVYGGSFDPVHNGHVMVVRQLQNHFDKVIIVPTKISPFKQEGASATATQRLQMLKLAINCDNNVEICDYEIQNSDISYTINTIKHLKSIYPNDQLHIVIGAENANKLHLWKDYNTLKELATFYAIPRPDFYVSLPKNVKLAPFKGTDVSSSQCKVALAFDRFACHDQNGTNATKIDQNITRIDQNITRIDQNATKSDQNITKSDQNIAKKATELMPLDVINYIENNHLYTLYDSFVAGFKQFELTQKRIEHTYLCTLYGIYLAKLHNADVQKVIVALILHDIAKTVGKTESAKSYAINPHQLDGLPLPVIHSELGSQIVQKYFGITDTEIIEAIRHHTSGAPNMTKLQEIVFLADKIELSRTYYGVQRIRNVAKKNLSKAMELCIRGTIEKLTKTEREVSPMSIKAMQYYKFKNRNTHK